MTIYNVHDAKTHFSKLLDMVLSGEEVVIAKAGKPIARLLPFLPQDLTPRMPGIDKGKVIIMPDFDAPLPEFDL
jgi:prevent-host-death family protein